MTPPLSAPWPGCVMMSIPSDSAEWFSAANASRTMWIDLISALGGSGAPAKLSTRMVALPPARSWSCCAISVGSSDRFSISCGVSTVLNALPRGSAAAACAFCATVTDSSIFFSGSTTHVLVVAAADPHLRQHADVEAGEFRLDPVAPGQQPIDGRDPLVGGGHRRKRRRARAIVQRADRHRRPGHDRAGRIDDRHDQSPVLRILRRAFHDTGEQNGNYQYRG